MSNRAWANTLTTIGLLVAVACTTATAKGVGESCMSNDECASGLCKGAVKAGGEAPAKAGTCAAAPTADGGGSGCTEGNYRCASKFGYGIEICKNGQWESAGGCDCSVSVGDPRKPPYATSCYQNASSVSCEYAGKACKACTNGKACN